MMGNRVFNAELMQQTIYAVDDFFYTELGVGEGSFTNMLNEYIGLGLYIGEETIIPEEMSLAEYKIYLSTRFRLALPDITVYKENLFSPTISNDISISRSLSGETNSANEMQPINASIDIIDSPTAKAKGISSATEDVTESRPNEIRENLLMRKEFRNILDILRGIIMPIFKFYTRIY